MAKPNYSFEKRQRELDKKRKQEEKRLRKNDGKSEPDGSGETAQHDSPPAATEPNSGAQ